MQNFLRSKGIMLVLSSPSGAGKSSLSKRLLAVDEHLKLSISYTTRKIRDGEKEGVDYYFTDEKHFHEMIEQDQFIEYANVFGNYYGTPRVQYREDILFDIDWQGARSLRNLVHDDVVSIYILPPSIKELEVRLRNREQDSEDVIQRRMRDATLEIQHYTEYDYVIINDNFEESFLSLKSILHAERLKRYRQVNLKEFVESLMV